MENQVIPRQKISAVVAAHDEAKALIAEGVEALRKAANIMNQTIGQSTTYTPDGLWSYSGLSWEDFNSEYLQSEIQKRAWRFLVDQTGIKRVLTEQALEEMNKQVEAGDLPDLTTESVVLTLQELASSMPDRLEEAVKEAYERVFPGWSRREYKTNEKVCHEGLKKKVILTCAFSWGTWMSQYAEKTLRCLERAFGLLDGHMPKDYPHDAVTKALQSQRETNDPHGRFEFSTDYFHCKGYVKASTLHVTFTNDSLLREFNRIGAGGAIGRKGTVK